VTQVADITGYSFVVDPRVKGKVTVLSSAPMNKDEIYDLFLAVLQVHGFTAIPGEEVIKVVQQVDAKQSAESLERFTEVPSEQLITRVIQIDNANALELVPILRPLVAKYGHLAGVAAANALIVSDHSSNIQRIEQIVRELDSPSKYEVEVIQGNDTGSRQQICRRRGRQSLQQHAPGNAVFIPLACANGNTAGGRCNHRIRKDRTQYVAQASADVVEVSAGYWRRLAGFIPQRQLDAQILPQFIADFDDGRLNHYLGTTNIQSLNDHFSFLHHRRFTAYHKCVQTLVSEH